MTVRCVGVFEHTKVINDDKCYATFLFENDESTNRIELHVNQNELRGNLKVYHFLRAVSLYTEFEIRFFKVKQKVDNVKQELNRVFNYKDLYLKQNIGFLKNLESINDNVLEVKKKQKLKLLNWLNIDELPRWHSDLNRFINPQKESDWPYAKNAEYIDSSNIPGIFDLVCKITGINELEELDRNSALNYGKGQNKIFILKVKDQEGREYMIYKPEVNSWHELEPVEDYKLGQVVLLTKLFFMMDRKYQLCMTKYTAFIEEPETVFEGYNNGVVRAAKLLHHSFHAVKSNEPQYCRKVYTSVGQIITEPDTTRVYTIDCYIESARYCTLEIVNKTMEEFQFYFLLQVSYWNGSIVLRLQEKVVRDSFVKTNHLISVLKQYVRPRGHIPYAELSKILSNALLGTRHVFTVEKINKAGKDQADQAFYIVKDYAKPSSADLNKFSKEIIARLNSLKKINTHN